VKKPVHRGAAAESKVVWDATELNVGRRLSLIVMATPISDELTAAAALSERLKKESKVYQLMMIFFISA